jgi:hypothetical protein
MKAISGSPSRAVQVCCYLVANHFKASLTSGTGAASLRMYSAMHHGIAQILSGLAALKREGECYVNEAKGTASGWDSIWFRGTWSEF